MATIHEAMQAMASWHTQLMERTMELQQLTLREEPKRVRTMNRDIVIYINSVMNNASRMVDHFAIEMPPESLYTMLCGDDYHMLDLLSKVAGYMKPGSYHDVVNVPVLLKGEAQITEVPFVVSMAPTLRYPCYLMPMHIGVITPESRWYHIIEPGLRLAQEWEMTKDLFQRFADLLTSDQMAFLLPWLKELARDAVIAMNSESDWKLITRNNLSHINTHEKKMKLMAAFNRLAEPRRANRTPALSSRINQVTRLGDKLFGQHRMLDGKPTPALNGSYFAISPSHKLLPHWYVSDMDDIIEHWLGKSDIYLKTLESNNDFE